MRICLIAREFPPDTGWGGIATFTRNLAEGLCSLGHEVEVVSLAKDKPKIDDQGRFKVHRVRPILEETNLELLGLLMPSSTYALSNCAALWQKFLELHKIKEFDVVDCPELLAEGLIPAMTKVVPLVVRLYTAHSKFIAERLHNIEPSFDYQLVAALERLAILNADVVTAPSLDLAKFVASDTKRPVDSIHIVRNPINADEFQPDGDKALTEPGQLKILFVGRLEERKGIHYLMKAVPSVLAKAPAAHFYVMGADTNTAPGGGSVKEELTRILDENQAAKHVTFLPRVPLTDLPTYYRSADICVVPSVYDNSPYTCLEAMSCGTAVVGTTSGGTPEYLTDEICGLLVPPRDESALAGAIIRLLTNQPEREKFANNARDRVLECFTATKIAEEMVALYVLARERFSQAHNGESVYEADLNNISNSIEQMLILQQEALHKMLYVKSFDYRLRHWTKMATTQPQKLFCKIVSRLQGGSRTKDA